MRSIEYLFERDGEMVARRRRISMNNTAMHGTAHLTLVPTPTAAELERMVGGGAADRGRVTPAALRLTRRGRLVVVALFLLTLFAGGVLFGSTATRATGEAGAPRDYQYLVVQPGQTLWGIAKEIAPQEDPRATIEAIRRLNALPDAGIEAGQRIALP
jgi:hypothetical protein